MYDLFYLSGHTRVWRFVISSQGANQSDSGIWSRLQSSLVHPRRLSRVYLRECTEYGVRTTESVAQVLLLASCKCSIVSAVIHTCYIPAVALECNPQYKGSFHTRIKIARLSWSQHKMWKQFRCNCRSIRSPTFTAPVGEDMQTAVVLFPEARQIISQDW
jgi:hypothetical protein